MAVKSPKEIQKQRRRDGEESQCPEQWVTARRLFISVSLTGSELSFPHVNEVGEGEVPRTQKGPGASSFKAVILSQASSENSTLITPAPEQATLEPVVKRQAVSWLCAASLRRECKSWDIR